MPSIAGAGAPELQGIGQKETSSWLELGVAFDEFYCATTGETNGETAVVFIAFDADDRTDAVFRMADFAAEHGICFDAAANGGAAEAAAF